jgi:poly [ADP-ribose] polymerase
MSTPTIVTVKKKIELKVKANMVPIPIQTPGVTAPLYQTNLNLATTKIAIAKKDLIPVNNLEANLALAQVVIPVIISSIKPEPVELTIKNGQVLDPYCTHTQGCVYKDYNCTLNMTDLKDNKNKFYIMQIIELGGNSYSLMKRYGRIGEKGMINYTPSQNVDYLCSEFEKVFKDKTKNNWSNRKQFVPANGKYYLCEVSYEEETQSTPTVTKSQIQTPIIVVPCTLDVKVQHFLSLVSNQDLITASLLRLEIDAKKMPLGKLSQGQLQKAYDVLKQIQTRMSAGANKDELMSLSSQFYILIPCVSSSRVTRLPTIANAEIITRLMSVVDELSNLQIAHSVLSTTNSGMHALDNVYQELKTMIRPLANQPMLQAILTYVKNTHGKTHTGYGIEVVNVYEIQRQGEKERYDTYCQQHQIDNKMLLWHGTRLTNYLSILKMGLVLRSDLIPGTIITGKMFGNGVYGANSFSKSFNYTGYDTSNPTQCLFLAEFALGGIDAKYDADYYVTEQSLKSKGYQSMQGIGKYTPNSTITIDGVTVPQGQLVKSDNYKECSLMYDEFIVYNEAQINLKYIVEVRASFN